MSHWFPTNSLHHLAKHLYSVNLQHPGSDNKDCSAERMLPASTGGSETWINRQITPGMPILYVFYYYSCENNAFPLQHYIYCLTAREFLATFEDSFELLNNPNTPRAWEWVSFFRRQEALFSHRKMLFQKLQHFFSQDCST